MTGETRTQQELFTRGTARAPAPRAVRDKVMSSVKRPAEETPTDAPDTKRTTAESSGCSWGSGACSFAAVASSGSGFGGVAAGGNGGCSWGSGSCSFAAVASSGTGFGAVAVAGAAPSAAPSSGFAAFSGGPATTFAVNTSPPAARSSGERGAATPTEEPSETVEAACTGEEDEICVHRVRAKLFRLEVRSCPGLAWHACSTPVPMRSCAR